MIQPDEMGNALRTGADRAEFLLQVQEEICELLRSRDSLSDFEDDREEELLVRIDELLMDYAKRFALNLTERHIVRTGVFNAMRRLNVLQELVDDPEISEIMVNGPDRIFIERAGRTMLWDKKFPSAQKLGDVIQQIVARSNRIVNETTPIVDTRLPNGSRVNVVLPPVAINGPILTIRRFPDDPFTMEDLLKNGTLSRETAVFLEQMVRCRMNIFVSGGTSSGKTTFLNVLADYIPPQERVITIEDSAELNLRHIPNLVRLECRDPNTEGRNGVTVRDLIRTALRMRPDRILVGEVRGEEAMDMITAMNTGHDGSLSTGHANSCRDMLRRLEAMLQGNMPAEMIRGQIVSGIELMVHLGRMRDGSRKLLRVEELTGMKNGEITLNPLIRYHPAGGGHEETWEIVGKLRRRDKLYGYQGDEESDGVDLREIIADCDSSGTAVL